MRFAGPRLAVAAIAIWVAAGATCRRPPLVGESTQDAGATTGDRPAQAVVEAGHETTADSIADGPGTDAPADQSSPDAPADSAIADVATDRSNVDAPPDMATAVDAPADMATADAPADLATADTLVDATPQDRPGGDGGDVRPDEQPCGSLGSVCAPYRCDVARGMCKTVCANDDDCTTGRPCRSGSCSPGLGSSCMLNAECSSSFCAQGTCCSSACDRLCSSCALPGGVGVCLPVPYGGMDPGARCGGGNVCNGRGQCIPPVCAVDTDCGPLHHCTNARCVPCNATCASTPDCAFGAICVMRNFCTYCSVADAGAGG